MSRKNYTHTMDAFIHGNKWSNFEGVTRSAFFKLANPTMKATRLTDTAVPIAIAEGDYEINRTTVTPTPAPTPTPTPIVAPIEETTPPILSAPKEPTYFKSVDTDVLTTKPLSESELAYTREARQSTATRVIGSPYSASLDENYDLVRDTSVTRQKPISGVPPTPVVNVITTPVLPSTPIAVTPAPIGGGGGGFGGGAIPSTEKPKVTSAIAEKPSFLKKNWLPIALVVSAIYVYIKKPI